MPLLPSAPPFATGPVAPPQGLLPLQGVTVLAVEDSRYASDALRLLCQRSGARLRRAETLAGARAHLSVYRPDVVFVDLGLPDGRGETLIAGLCQARRRPAAILALSGDPDGRRAALAAGADDFVDKPIASLAAFQACLLRHLSRPGPAGAEPAMAEPAPAPDPMALYDDLARAESLIRATGPAPLSPWLQGFITSLARQTGDHALQAAARGGTSAEGAGALQGMLRQRLAGDSGLWK